MQRLGRERKISVKKRVGSLPLLLCELRRE